VGSLSKGREMASGTRRKMGDLLSGLTACNSTLPLFVLLVVSTHADCMCLHCHRPFAGILPRAGWLEPALETCPVLRSRLGRQGRKGSTELPCEQQLVLPRARRYICTAQVSVLPWSGVVARGIFLLLFLVRCSLGLGLPALLK